MNSNNYLKLHIVPPLFLLQVNPDLHFYRFLNCHCTRMSAILFGWFFQTRLAQMKRNCASNAGQFLLQPTITKENSIIIFFWVTYRYPIVRDHIQQMWSSKNSTQFNALLRSKFLAAEILRKKSLYWIQCMISFPNEFSI